MACDITAGRLKVCKESNGGLRKLYLFNYVENPFTVSNGVVTALNPLLTFVYEYELEGDGNTFGENMPSDRNSGTTVNTQTLTIVLKKQDAVTSAQLTLLAKGFPMAVVRDRNNVYHAIGIDDGIDFTIAPQTGGAKTEMNGYTLTGVATTKDLSPKLDSEAIAEFLALVD